MNDNSQLEEKLALIDQMQSACTGCGLCAEGCATFQHSGWEHESPRGRLHLAAQFIHGKIEPSSAALETFERCLGCRACESLCPQQVPYHRVRDLVQEVRSELNPSSSSHDRLAYKRWIKIASRIVHRGWRQFGARWLASEWKSSGSFSKKKQRPSPGQPVLAFCCVQDLYHHDVIEQALLFMEKLGCRVEVDKKQPCCGALFEKLIHGMPESVVFPKERKKAMNLQRVVLEAFLKWLPSKTYFLSKGCRCFVSRHTTKTADLYAWIETILEEKKLKLIFEAPQVVYYQPYCGGEYRENDPIWRLFKQIEGLKVIELVHPRACCGGYGGNALLQPEQAQALAHIKLASIPHDATLIVTSPDCWGLFKANAAANRLTLLYPIQLLNKTSLKLESN